VNRYEELQALRDFAAQPLEIADLPEPLRMEATADRLMRRLKAESVKPRQIDLLEMHTRLRKAFEEEGENCLHRLPKSDLRYLPWTLVQGEVDERALTWPGLLKSAIREMKASKRQSRLTGWIRVYLQEFDQRSAELRSLRSALEKQLDAYDGANPRLTCWRERRGNLFGKKAVENCSKMLLQDAGTATDVLERLGLVDELADGGFVSAVVEDLVKRAATDLEAGLGKVLELLEIERDGVVSLRRRELAEVAISTLLPAAGEEANSAIREPLKAFALHHLKDPRLPGNRPHWLRIEERAREVLSRWIAHADVEFFFNLVEQAAKDKHWKYRKRFWEGYVDHFEVTWVALGPRARRLAQRVSNKEHAESRSFGTLRGAESSQSVFLIRMGGFDFVEWSNSGACRIWALDATPIDFGGDEYLASDFRSANFAHRQIHTYNSSRPYAWQRELAAWIQQHTGLKATRSFSL
jgi:hypothetical protein